MSKHFELLQQIENERSFGTESDAGVSIAPIPEIHHSTEIHHSRAIHHSSEAIHHSAEGWASDEAQRLVQQIFLLQSQEPPRVVTFAGVDHGNGCSHICAAVAQTLARNDRGRVCLVEANFRSPTLPEMFGVPNHFGLTEALLRDGPVGNFAKPVQQTNLWLLSSGTVAVDSFNLLASDHLRTRVDELRAHFDFVIIDAPPLNRYSDAVVLGQLSDGLVMVIEANTTRREAAAAVAENLRSAKVPILAAVLNKRTFPIPQSIYKML